MEIKPTGQGGPLIPPSPDAREKVERAQQPAGDAIAMLGDLTQASGALKTISAQFQKSDVKDPAKLDKMVSILVGELVDTAATRTNQPLNENHKTFLRNWMSNDPVIRGKVINCVEQSLK